MEPTPTRLILGIDPGEELSGLSLLMGGVGSPADIQLMFSQRVPNDKLGTIIEKAAPKKPIICYEQYRVFNSKLSAHRFSRVQTIETIGMIEYLTKKFNLETHRSMSVNHKSKSSPITEKWMRLAGVWTEGDPGNHKNDATRCGCYHWKIRGILNGGKLVMTQADRTILGLKG